MFKLEDLVITDWYSISKFLTNTEYKEPDGCYECPFVFYKADYYPICSINYLLLGNRFDCVTDKRIRNYDCALFHLDIKRLFNIQFPILEDYTGFVSLFGLEKL